ncbi:MAG: DUF2231 domain-containing protein [Myxococcaceae bacterium]
MPLHPAIVHLPVGLAMAVPLVALALMVARWRGLLPAGTFAVVLGMQALVLGGGVVAYETGGTDGEKVEKVVAEKYIERHEETAEVFLFAQGLALLLTAGALIARGKASLIAPGLATAAAIAVAALGLRTGHLGGELVYQHGAASVYTAPKPVEGAPSR